MPRPESRRPRTPVLAALALLVATGCGRREDAAEPKEQVSGSGGTGAPGNAALPEPHPSEAAQEVVQPVPKPSADDLYARITASIDRARAATDPTRRLQAYDEALAGVAELVQSHPASALAESVGTFDKVGRVSLGEIRSARDEARGQLVRDAIARRDHAAARVLIQPVEGAELRATLERAIRSEERREERPAEFELALSRIAAGDLESATLTLLEAVRQDAPLVEADARLVPIQLAAAEARLVLGDGDTSAALLEDVQPILAGPSSDPVGSVLTWTRLLTQCGQVEEVETWLARHVPQPHRSRAMAVAAAALFERAERDEARALFGRALGTARLIRTPADRDEAIFEVAQVCAQVGDLESWARAVDLIEGDLRDDPRSGGSPPGGLTDALALAQQLPGQERRSRALLAVLRRAAEQGHDALVRPLAALVGEVAGADRVRVLLARDELQPGDEALAAASRLLADVTAAAPIDEGVTDAALLLARAGRADLVQTLASAPFDDWPERVVVLARLARKLAADGEDPGAVLDEAAALAEQSGEGARRARAEFALASAGWSLERAAWASEHFTKACALLVKLSAGERAGCLATLDWTSIPEPELVRLVGWLRLEPAILGDVLAADGAWAEVWTALSAAGRYDPGHASLIGQPSLAVALAPTWGRAGRWAEAVRLLATLEHSETRLAGVAHIALSLARTSHGEGAGGVAGQGWSETDIAREEAALAALVDVQRLLEAGPRDESVDARLERCQQAEAALAEVLAVYPESSLSRARGASGSLVTMLEGRLGRRRVDALLVGARVLAAEGQLDEAWQELASVPLSEPVEPWQWELYREWLVAHAAELARQEPDSPAGTTSGRRPLRDRRDSGSRRSHPDDGASLAACVERGLVWLARQQSEDGHWSAATTGGQEAHDVGITGLALLAFLQAGHGPDQGEHRLVVRRGIRWLVSVQQPDGCLGAPRSWHHSYDHLVGTLVLVEAHGLSTREPQGVEREGRIDLTGASGPIARALDFALSLRNPGAGWRYLPGEEEMLLHPNDASVTGWAVKALARARDVGLPIDATALEEGLTFIEVMTDPSTGRTGYLMTGGGSARLPGAEKTWTYDQTEAITAVGVLCRLLVDPGLTRPGARDMAALGAENMLRLPISWSEEPSLAGRVDFYYWHHATAALRRMGGSGWEQWSQGLEQIVAHQVVEGDGFGSWDPAVDPWGSVGGRVYATALLTMTVEEGRAER